MKSLFILLVTFSFSSAYAGVFSSLDLDSLINSDGRAETYVERGVTLNKGRAINLLKSEHTSESCGEAVIDVGRTNAIETMKSYYEEHDLAETLEDLYNAGKIIFAVVGRDGDEGESEYCSTATYHFFSVDGELLQIYFDFNT